MIEALGTKLRRQRRRLGLTLDELAQKASISKPYLSLIETGRVPNPPSDEKLRRLEKALDFKDGELVSHAHLHRTPRDVRAMLIKLIRQGKATPVAAAAGASAAEGATGSNGSHGSNGSNGVNGANGSNGSNGSAHSSRARPKFSQGIDLDDAYLSGVLQQLVDQSAGNVETIATTTQAIPVINKISAGYPRDFTDLSYPPRVADDYVGCPDVQDRDAFAARVHGDSMRPKYQEGDIVIFSPAAGPKNGDDCFVRFASGQTTFKRVFFESDKDGNPVIRLQPRNERYPPQIVPSQEIAGLYKAIYRYQRVDGD